jgi:hypothetical protein
MKQPAAEQKSHRRPPIANVDKSLVNLTKNVIMSSKVY